MKNMSEAVLAAINTSLAQAPPWTFFKFNELPLFEPFRRAKLPALLGLTTTVPLAPDRIIHSLLPPTKLPIGHMHYPSSLGVAFGYIIEVPPYPMTVFPHYATVVLPKAAGRTGFTDARAVHQNPHLNIFWSEDGALLVSFADRPTFFDPTYLRGGH